MHLDARFILNVHSCQRRESSTRSPHPHLQIPHRRSHVALGPLRDLPGDGDGSTPPPGEELRENLVCGWLEADRLKPGLEALGQVTDVEVRGAEECVACGQAVEVGEQQVLRVA